MELLNVFTIIPALIVNHYNKKVTDKNKLYIIPIIMLGLVLLSIIWMIFDGQQYNGCEGLSCLGSVFTYMFGYFLIYIFINSFIECLLLIFYIKKCIKSNKHYNFWKFIIIYFFASLLVSYLLVVIFL